MKLTHVYIFDTVGVRLLLLCLYVDDILIFGSNLNVIDEVKKLLASNFDLKDLD